MVIMIAIFLLPILCFVRKKIADIWKPPNGKVIDGRRSGTGDLYRQMMQFDLPKNKVKQDYYRVR